MGDCNFEIATKAIALMEYTYTITSNREKYPVKYIQLMKRIQNKCMDIYECLIEANRLNADECFRERRLLQSKAITYCDELSCYAELSMNMHRISSRTLNHWQKLITDVKYMTIAWRKKK